MKNNLDKQYLDLLQNILDNGTRNKNRTGVDTISVFGSQIRHKMNEGFPLLTTKKMAWRSMIVELIWFLRGDTNIKYLIDNNCHIWDGDAYKRYFEHTIIDVNTGLDRIKGHLDNCLVEFDGHYEYFTNPSFQYGFRPHTKEEFINKIKTDNKFSEKWGELGPIYGNQWRRWKTYKHAMNFDPYVPINKDGKTECYIEIIDQISNLIKDLKTNPDSRRLMVSAWNVGELDDMVLPPCHYAFQLYTRELNLEERKKIYENKFNGGVEITNDYWLESKLETRNIPLRAISLMWNQRSVDVPLGLPFNISSYATLLEIIAKEVNMIPDELIGNLGDTHIYVNQIEGIKEQLTREPFELPTLKISEGVKWKEGDCLPYYSPSDFEIIGYKSHPKIKLTLSN